MKKSILLFMLIVHVVMFSQKKSKTLVTINDSKITVADLKKFMKKIWMQLIMRNRKTFRII